MEQQVLGAIAALNMVLRLIKTFDDSNDTVAEEDYEVFDY